MTEMADCVKDPSIIETIQEDIEESNRLEITGTPAFVINGELVSGYKPLDFWVEKIDEILQGKPAKPVEKTQ